MGQRTLGREKNLQLRDVSFVSRTSVRMSINQRASRHQLLWDVFLDATSQDIGWLVRGFRFGLLLGSREGSAHSTLSRYRIEFNAVER